ncbi:MAG: extensin, partial [Xanthobacteraceae bacterium]
NVYHYNHIHVDLMRHYNGRHICEPAAIPGEVAAARARSQYAAQHYGDPRSTGSIKARGRADDRGSEDESLPDAVPGDD